MWVLGHLGVRRQRAEERTIGPHLDPAQLIQRPEVQKMRGGEDPHLEEHHQIRAAGEGNGARVRSGHQVQGLRQVARPFPTHCPLSRALFPSGREGCFRNGGERGFGSGSSGIVGGGGRTNELGGLLDRPVDACVAGAPADVACQGVADLCQRGPRVRSEEGVGGQHHARRADPALSAALGEHGVLERGEPRCVRRRQAFDGGHGGAVDLPHGKQARVDQEAVHQHGTRPALALAAPFLRPREAEAPAEQIQEAGQRVRLDVVDCAVHRQPEAEAVRDHRLSPRGLFPSEAGG